MTNTPPPPAVDSVAPDGTKPCVICAESIQKAAYVCVKCKAYQDWRKHFYLTSTLFALTVSAITICGGIYGATNYIYKHVAESKTTFQVASASEDAIYLHVTNSGPKPSALFYYQLKFAGGGLPIEDARLRLVKDDARSAKNMIAADSEVNVGLTSLGLTPKAKPESGAAQQYYADTDMEPLLEHATVTLQVCVQESDRSKCVWKSTETFAAKVIQDFILERTPHDVP